MEIEASQTEPDPDLRHISTTHTTTRPMSGVALRTERLLLRQWRDEDLEAWTAMNGDPEVNAFLPWPALPISEISARSLRRFKRDIEERGWGFWAVEIAATGEFVGMAGLDPVEEGHGLEGVEVGWRLARSAWGKGYATEAARAALKYGFETLGLHEILSTAAAGNVRSRAVMTRIGMDFVRDFTLSIAPESMRTWVVYRIPAPKTVRTAGED